MLNSTTNEWNQCQLLGTRLKLTDEIKIQSSALFFFTTLNFHVSSSISWAAKWATCWWGSRFGSLRVPLSLFVSTIDSFLITHYAILKPCRRQFITTCKRERWRGRWKGKRSWNRLSRLGYVSLKWGGNKQKKKLTQQTMRLERESCIIFGPDDELINHSNESRDAGIVGKQKQMTSWG